ncbi:hypothetical protein ACFCYM_30500 [Streptomyces sp. NPDC056254]
MDAQGSVEAAGARVDLGDPGAQLGITDLAGTRPHLTVSRI